jgi:leucyl/phenylalanyl-tRNA--protein transferase
MMMNQEVDAIVGAYSRGAFLMAGPDGRLGWYQSRQHAIFPLDEPMPFPKSLRRVLNGQNFECAIDQDFLGCVQGCADRSETWISEELQHIYLMLFRAGVAHSFEAWHEGQLAGGILGLTLGRAFIGESMFYCVPDASKCALVRLHRHLRDCGFELFDAQMMNPHLARFGAVAIQRPEYLPLLENAISLVPKKPLASQLIL